MEEDVWEYLNDFRRQHGFIGLGILDPHSDRELETPGLGHHVDVESVSVVFLFGI
jgi:hypothetical protein